MSKKIETKVDISTKKWTGEMEDLLKIETLRHRDCILDTPPPEATTLPRNIPEAANWEGLGHARLPQVHKVGGARSDMVLNPQRSRVSPPAVFSFRISAQKDGGNTLSRLSYNTILYLSVETELRHFL